MKVTHETLHEVFDSIMTCCNKGELVKIAQLSGEFKHRLDWLFEPDTLYRFASVVFFDLTEEINDYDIEYNKEKIKNWKKKSYLEFFLKELMTGSEFYLNSSQSDSREYLQQLNIKKENQKKLISEIKDLENK